MAANKAAANPANTSVTRPVPALVGATARLRRTTRDPPWHRTASTNVIRHHSQDASCSHRASVITYEPSLEGCGDCAVRGLDLWSGRVTGTRC